MGEVVTGGQASYRGGHRSWWPWALAGLLAGLPAAASAAEPPAEVKANYEVNFAGVNIGDFHFNSEVNGRSYKITSSTTVKLLFGAFKWTSRSESHGLVHQAVKPEAFDFRYRSNRKRFHSEVRFAQGDVTKLVNTPPIRPSKKRVALEAEHLKQVMDPMSAILAMTRGINRDPCRQSMAVFEGRVRFKLTLSPKGQRRIAERGNSGQPRTGPVCRVRFEPVAGHKPSRMMARLAASKDIEVVLRPVPAADLFVPYQITVPTGYGTVSIVSRNVVIVGGKRQRIALRH